MFSFLGSDWPPQLSGIHAEQDKKLRKELDDRCNELLAEYRESIRPLDEEYMEKLKPLTEAHKARCSEVMKAYHEAYDLIYKKQYGDY